MPALFYAYLFASPGPPINSFGTATLTASLLFALPSTCSWETCLTMSVHRLHQKNPSGGLSGDARSPLASSYLVGEPVSDLSPQHSTFPLESLNLPWLVAFVATMRKQTLMLYSTALLPLTSGLVVV